MARMLLALVFAAASVSARAAEPAAGRPSFERDIVPILAAHCFKCHGLEARKAELDLRTVGLMRRGGESGAVLVPGSLDESPLWTQVADRSMPPQGELPLSDEKIDVIKRWIAAGAPAANPEAAIRAAEAPAVSDDDRGYWAFQKSTRPRVPAVRTTAAVRTPADAFVLEKLEAKGLSYSPPAEPAALVRRLFFDLLGLPPSPEEVERFAAECAAQGDERAYELLVDRLLASPHFGERWGRHWLDVAGYVDVLGSDNDAAIIKIAENKWLYRDYVVAAVNADLPFDRFLTEQLAGDEMVDWRAAEKFTPEIRRLLAATGYLRAAVDDTDQKELNTADIRFRVLHLSLEIVGTGLLGLTTGCARCHSHKFDPIPQRDYYRMMALLAPAYNPQAWVPLHERYLPDVSPAEQKQVAEHNAAIDRQIEPLKGKIAAVETACRQKLFEQKLASLPEPIRADSRAALEAAVENRSEVQKYLAEKFAAALAVKPEEIAAGLNEQDKALITGLNGQIHQLNGQKRGWGKLQATYDVGPPPPTFVLRRGDHETPGAEVEPGFLSVLCDDDGVLRSPPQVSGTSSGRRTALARWLTDPNSRAGALVARVVTNRIWQHLFGVGIVATSENFGHQGTPPTHRELLDWLAAEFIENGWHTKPLVRMLVASSVYRQASAQAPVGLAAGGLVAAANGPDPEAVDPANELLWRTRLRRLESEAVRDSILAASGKLDRTLGGPPIELENRPDGMVVVDEKKLRTPTSKYRRSLYVLARRNYHLSLLNDFDQPALATNCPRRSSSAVVLQSLTLMNDAFVGEQAVALAERAAAAEPGAAVEQQIAAAFRFALARPPKPPEASWALDLVRRQADRYRAAQVPPEQAERKALVHVCHALLASNEFLYVP